MKEGRKSVVYQVRILCGEIKDQRGGTKKNETPAFAPKSKTTDSWRAISAKMDSQSCRRCQRKQKKIHHRETASRGRGEDTPSSSFSLVSTNGQQQPSLQQRDIYYLDRAPLPWRKSRCIIEEAAAAPTPLRKACSSIEKRGLSILKPKIHSPPRHLFSSNSLCIWPCGGRANLRN